MSLQLNSYGDGRKYFYITEYFFSMTIFNSIIVLLFCRRIVFKYPHIQEIVNIWKKYFNEVLY